jgi:ABC-2 type transport system permease protein
VLRRFRAAGLPLSAVIGSQVVVAVGLVAIGAVGIAIAARVIYGALLPESWPQVFAAFVLGVACFSAIGVALGALMPTARAAQGLGLILFFVMMMIGGAGPPREVLATPMRWFGDGLPLTYVVLTLQTPWLGYGWDWVPSVVVVFATAVAAAIALRFFRWE